MSPDPRQCNPMFAESPNMQGEAPAAVLRGRWDAAPLHNSEVWVAHAVQAKLAELTKGGRWGHRSLERSGDTATGAHTWQGLCLRSIRNI